MQELLNIAIATKKLTHQPCSKKTSLLHKNKMLSNFRRKTSRKRTGLLSETGQQAFSILRTDVYALSIIEQITVHENHERHQRVKNTENLSRGKLQKRGQQCFFRAFRVFRGRYAM
jgi:hypothetical protein